MLDLTSSSLGAYEDIALVKASVFSAVLNLLCSFILSMVAGVAVPCKLSNCSATGLTWKTWGLLIKYPENK